MRSYIFLLGLILASFISRAQSDSTELNKLSLTADFRFRIEHDWNSRKPDGSFRTDRSRLRYRLRFGLSYNVDDHSSFGGRMRSGNLDDQQGPHITLGGNNGEFGLVNFGFEKLYYQYKTDRLKFWVGKNSLLARKLNELFWNDNVFPEGIAASYRWPLSLNNSLAVNAGHYVIQSLNGSLLDDKYFQLLQFDFELFDKVSLFPSFYYFHQIGNLPDGNEEFVLDYSILHLGANVRLLEKPLLDLGVEWYNNLQDYADNNSIENEFKDQKDGYVVTLKLGEVKKQNDWALHLYYANLEQFAIVDYFAQNDWVRWDYSSINAFGSRISNFQGVEIRIIYGIKENFRLNLRTYFVEQLLARSNFKETGSRIRLDLDIGF